MDLNETREMVEFRREVRDWVKANYPYETHDPYNYTGRHPRGKDNEWYRKMGEKGWLAYRWPKESGGAGFTPPQQIVFIDELQNCDAQVPAGFGITMIGPLLLQFGTEAQKKRFLPPIATNQEIWCQGYSEPNAGSDLASLQTRAELKGDHFIVNGQKTWTSGASLADYIFCLVRTDTKVKKQEGISFLLIDMKSPGLSIRPIQQINGHAGFFETFFDDVKVPAENLVGEINKGWTMAKALLGHERAGASDEEVPDLVRRIKVLARDIDYDGKPLLEDAEFRQKLATLEMDADCLRYVRLRLTTAIMQGRAPGPEASVIKVFQSETTQHLYTLGLEALGPDALCWYDKRLPPEGFKLPMANMYARAMSIFSGSNEVQRNIISKRVLALPG